MSVASSDRLGSGLSDRLSNRGGDRGSNGSVSGGCSCVSRSSEGSLEIVNIDVSIMIEISHNSHRSLVQSVNGVGAVWVVGGLEALLDS